MDSYAAALRQVADQHQDSLTPAPLWLKTANDAIGRQAGGYDALLQEQLADSPGPAPRLPPRSSLRSRSSFAQLERVIEETASERSLTDSLVLSTSCVSTTSEAGSIQTVIYNPQSVDTYTASSSGNESASIGSHMSATRIASQCSPGKDASYTPATSLTGADSASGFGFCREESPKGALQFSNEQNRSRSKANDWPVTGQTSFHKPTENAATHKRPELEETAPAPKIPREPKSEEHTNQSKLTARLKSVAHVLVTKLNLGHPGDDPCANQTSEQPMKQFEPMTEAIDAMIAGLETPHDDLKTSSEDRSHHNYRTEDSSGPPLSSGPDSRPKVKRPSPPNTYETTRDGVPILMRQKSGVWVEAVEGAQLTSVQDQQQNIPKGQPIAEREAEDIPEITLPDDPWNNLPPYIRLEYGTANSSSPAQRNKTRSRRNEATASWAQDQVDIRQQPGSTHLTEWEPTPDARSPKQSTPGENLQLQPSRPRRQKLEGQSNEAPFYYDKGRVRPSASHPSNIPPDNLTASAESSHSSIPSHKPSSSDSSPNTALTPSTPDSPPPRNPRRDTPAARLDMQERIAQSASAVELLIYGMPAADSRGSGSRFERIELL